MKFEITQYTDGDRKIVETSIVETEETMEQLLRHLHIISEVPVKETKEVKKEVKKGKK